MLPYLPAFAKMLPVLKARESLSCVLEIAVGTSNVKKGFARRVLNEWRFQARKFSTRQKPIKAKTKEEHHAMLASIGIQVVPPNG